jgi:hypothetical protein
MTLSKSSASLLFGSSLRALVLLLAFAILSLPHQAQAGEGVLDFVQMTCIPELGYFALRTTTLSRELPNHKVITDGSFKGMSTRLESQNQMYSPEHLLRQPYECKLPTRLVTVRIEGYVAPHETGECALIEQFDISIGLNGEQIDKFPAYGVNRCTSEEARWFSLDAFDLLQDCSYERYGNGSSCTSKRIHSQSKSH